MHNATISLIKKNKSFLGATPMKKNILALSICTLITLTGQAQARDAGYYDLIEEKTMLELSESAE